MFSRAAWRGMTRNGEGRVKVGINNETDDEAGIQIGPTDRGMVRIYVSNASIDLPMDFEPDEAEEIAEELMVAAAAARKQGGRKKR